eukprot:TRINITY_DN3488_c3_g1_i1.p1 TRINITY_DN3488_c3_g1~~TRINITY_DN3488_c3_g1_i1.p1  ORF type:complete len:260 (+),score=85.59 TRINITY_DN3488_c3_g1_i1:68-781(+)
MSALDGLGVNRKRFHSRGTIKEEWGGERGAKIGRTEREAPPEVLGPAAEHGAAPDAPLAAPAPQVVFLEHAAPAQSSTLEPAPAGAARDVRPLWERLREQEEQKNAEQLEKFANKPPRGLDDEEVDFLDEVEKGCEEARRKRAMEDREAGLAWAAEVKQREDEQALRRRAADALSKNDLVPDSEAPPAPALVPKLRGKRPRRHKEKRAGGGGDPAPAAAAAEPPPAAGGGGGGLVAY